MCISPKHNESGNLIFAISIFMTLENISMAEKFVWWLNLRVFYMIAELNTQKIKLPKLTLANELILTPSQNNFPAFILTVICNATTTSSVVHNIP